MTNTRHVALMPGERASDRLPDPGRLQEDQHLEAVQHLYVDKSDYPRFSRLKSVHSLAGALAPAEVVMIGAQPGAGKSLFCQNLFDDLTAEQKIPTLYIGTEQSPSNLKTKHACIRAGVPAKLIIKPESHEIGTPDYELAMQRVHHELGFLNTNEMRELAYYATTRYVNRAELERWITGGVEKYGIRTVIIDHIDQMDHGPGENSAQETTVTVQMIHDLARDHSMPIIVASQLKRPHDSFQQHSPPEQSEFANSASKERIAAIMFGLWRPLRRDLKQKELQKLLKDAQQGHTGQDRIYMPNTMGVRLLKDRLGAVPGRQVMLYVEKGGRLQDDEATTHGISTSGTLR